MWIFFVLKPPEPTGDLFPNLTKQSILKGVHACNELTSLSSLPDIHGNKDTVY